MWGRLTTCAAVDYRRRSAANEAGGRLTIGPSLPSCPTRSRLVCNPVIISLSCAAALESRCVFSGGAPIRTDGARPQLPRQGEQQDPQERGSQNRVKRGDRKSTRLNSS